MRVCGTWGMLDFRCLEFVRSDDADDPNVVHMFACGLSTILYDDYFICAERPESRDAINPASARSARKTLAHKTHAHCRIPRIKVCMDQQQ